jgi:hypothetical protein
MTKTDNGRSHEALAYEGGSPSQEIETCWGHSGHYLVIGVNAVSALGQHFNKIAADAIADCIGGQILQSMPLFASMSSGGLDASSIATQIAMAFLGSALLTIFPSILSKLRARPHSRFLCLALPLSKSGAEYPKED